MATAPDLSNIRRFSNRRSARSKGGVLPFAPERVIVDKAAETHPQAIRILNKLGSVEVDVVDSLKCLKHPSNISNAKRQMVLTLNRGRAFKPCQGSGGEYFCCGYHTLDLVSGCPMECSYCILQSYLANNPVTTVYVNLETVLEEMNQFLSSHSSKFFRIGTGELSDSLAHDPITEFSSILVPFFASKKNAFLELKTKTALVDQLLNLRHGGRTVVAWSLNRPSLIATEESGTATLEERLEAARKVITAGYQVAFHFDPIIIVRNAEEELADYLEVIDKLLASIELRHIAWVSLGMLRYPSDLPRIALKRFPDSKIFAGEMVPADDKVRYFRLVREKVYKAMWERLSAKLPASKLYLCMETKVVWEKINAAVTSGAAIENRICNTSSATAFY